MPHRLEIEYGLTANEILDAVERHFRAKVALEGVVAETICKKYLEELKNNGDIRDFQEIDEDNKPDFRVALKTGKSITIEVKNVRDTDEAFRSGGEVVAYKVETQKTRSAKGDYQSRLYDADHFDLLAVCLGKKTKNWKNFLFVRTDDLERHAENSNKLASMQRVPMPSDLDKGKWSSELKTIITSFQ